MNRAAMVRRVGGFVGFAVSAILTVLFVTFVGILAVRLLSLLFGAGCTPAIDEPALYAQEMKQCVDQAETKESADRCRDYVKWEWECRWTHEFPDAGIWTCPEGGAP